MALRYDRGSLGAVTKTPQGGLRIPASVARVGILTYRNPDGTERRELRLPEEVFNADSMASLSGAPVTNLHPPSMVGPDNFRQYSAGHVAEGSARQDGDVLVADLLVQAGDLAGLVLEGERKDVSCGYVCDIEETPGVYQGEHYDCVQRNIRQNHVALGPAGWGRSGSTVALRLDSAGDCLPPGTPETGKPMDKIERIDGVEYTVGTPPHAAAVARRDLTEAESKLASQKQAEKIEALQKRVDELEGELVAEKAAGDARVALMRTVDALGIQVPEGATDDDIRKLVIMEASPELDLEGKDAAYLAAAFDIASDMLSKRDVGEVRGDGGVVSLKTELQKARERRDAAEKAAIIAGRTAGQNRKG